MRISNLIILMLFSVSGYSQPSEDIRQITQLMVDDYAVDSIKVYYKYDNSGLANDLEEAKLLVDMETMKELDLTNDSISIDEQLSMFDENVI